MAERGAVARTPGTGARGRTAARWRGPDARRAVVSAARRGWRRRCPGRRTRSPSPAAGRAAPAGCPARPPANSPSASLQRRRRDGEQGRAAQHPAHGGGHLAVGDGLGGGEVHRAGQRLRVQDVAQRRDVVVQRDEAPVLAAVAQPAAEPRLEEREEPAPGAALAGDDQTGAGEDRPDARLLGGRRRLLPLHADGRQETLAGRRALVDGAVAGVAVVADGGAGQQDLRRGVQGGDGLGDGGRAQHPAVADLLLVRVGPAVVPDPGAREVDDGVAAGQARRVDVLALRVPLHLVTGGGAGGRTRRTTSCPSARSERTSAAADESGGAGDRDADAHGVHPAPWAPVDDRNPRWHSGAHVRAAIPLPTPRPTRRPRGRARARRARPGHLVDPARRAAEAAAAVRAVLRRPAPARRLSWSPRPHRRHGRVPRRLHPARWRPTPLACNAHVRQIQGLVVAGGRGGHGVARALLRRGVRRGAAAGRRTAHPARARPQQRPRGRSTRPRASPSRACCRGSSSWTGGTSTTC